MLRCIRWVSFGALLAALVEWNAQCQAFLDRHFAADSAWSGFANGDKCIAPVEPPSAHSEAHAKHREAVSGALESFWDNSLSGYGISREDQAVISRATEVLRDPLSIASEGDRPSTYGEITALGARQMARAMSLDNLTTGEPLVFFDLGSGVGKLVVQAFLEWPAVECAVGVELSMERSARAHAAWSRLLESGEAARLRAVAETLHEGERKRHLIAPENGLQLITGDLLAADVSEATHMYTASLCFEDVLLRRLATKLAAEAPRMRAVVSLKRFPEGLAGFVMSRELQVQTSWTAARGATSTAYLYTRQDQ